MQERQVAIGNQTLYPEKRGGKVMPNGVKSAEIAKAGKDISEEIVGKVETEAVKGERVKRERELLKELEEVRHARHKTKAAEPIKPPSQERPQAVAEPVKPTKENPVIVSNFPHLDNQPREVVEFLLKKAKVEINVPDGWDKLIWVEKKRWLEEHGIIDTVKLPDIDESSLEEGFIVKTEVDGRKIGLYKRRGKEEYVVGGLPYREVKCETFTRIFKNAGVNIEIPINLDTLPFEEKMDVLAKLGIEVVPEGYNLQPQPRWESPTATVTEPRELYSRLDSLDTDEQTMGTVAFLASGRNLDRQEILERFRSEEVRYPDPARVNWDALREFHIEDALIRLRGLESIERILGTADFNAVGLDANREELYSKIIENWGADEVIRRLFDYSTGPAPTTIAGIDERNALRKALEYQIVMTRRINAPTVTEKNGYMFVNHLAKAVAGQQVLAEANGQLPQLDTFLPRAIREEVLDIRRNLDQHFRGLVKSLGSKAESELFTKFDNRVKTFESRLQLGTIASLTELEHRMYEEAVIGVQLRGKEGILEWRAAQLFDGIERGLARERELGTPNYWRDSLRNANNNFRYVESTNAPLDQLQVAIRRVTAISEALSQVKGDDAEEAQRMKDEIDSVKNAVEAKFIQKREMMNSGLDPEKIQGIFAADQWSDTTHRDYYRRFTKDHEQNDFEYVDPATGEPVKFNLLDKSMKVIFKQLYDEKKQMNEVEELTLLDISRPLSDGDYASIERRLGRAIVDRTKLENLRREFAAAKKIEVGISDWYRQNLLLGAHGAVEVNKVKRDALDIRRSELMGTLEKNLRNLNASADWQSRVDAYGEAGLLSQVVNVAYWETWMMGAFSDYDGIRVYDRSENGGWFGDKRKLSAFVYNTETSMWGGRNIDHFGEHLQDESRGRPMDVNWIFRKHLLGKRRGILGNNRLLVKLIADKLSEDLAIADKLVISGGRNFKQVLEDKMLSIENGDKLDIGDLSVELAMNDPRRYDRGWVRGASIEELIDDCEISFENIDWSEVYENEATNVIEYNMIDWWGDRAEAKKFFASGAMQEYLKNPGTKFFFQMNKDIFYSKREIRIQPWMKLVIPAHQEIGKHWQEWWKLPYDMPHAETKRVIDEAVRLNMLHHQYRDVLEDKLLGWGPLSGSFLFGRVKALRYLMETADRNVREFGKQDWELLFFWPLEFFKVVGQQSFAQLAGK